MATILDSMAEMPAISLSDHNLSASLPTTASLLECITVSAVLDDCSLLVSLPASSVDCRTPGSARQPNENQMIFMCSCF